LEIHEFIYALAGFWFRCCRQTASDVSQPKNFGSVSDPAGKTPCLSTPTGCLLHNKRQNAVTIGYSTLRRLRKHFLGFTRKIPLAEILFVRRTSAAFEVRLTLRGAFMGAHNFATLIEVIGPISMFKNTGQLQIISMRSPMLHLAIVSASALVSFRSPLVSNCYTLGLEL
jgi:hypothetical protein